MKSGGSTQPTPLAVVLSHLEQRLQPLPAEEVAWNEAAGRILAEAVSAPVPLPAFARAAMDGFAVRAADLSKASPQQPVALHIQGTLPAGRCPDRPVQPGCTVRVMTGAAIPPAADAVVMQEECELAAGGTQVLFRQPTLPGRHVIAVGEDVAVGQIVLPAGRRLRPQDVALLAALQLDRCRVVRRPRVGLLVTGGELVPPGERPIGYQIVDSNSPMLAALIQRDGGQLTSLHRLPDRLETLRQALLQAADAQVDLLLVNGGSSQGDEDYVPQAVEQVGELCAHGLALKPGGPAGLGWLPRPAAPLPVVLLPGYPAACLAVYELLAGRIVRRLGGRSWHLTHRRITVPLRDQIPSRLGRLDWVRVCLEQGQAVPLLQRGASSLGSLCAADGFVLVPEEVPEYPAGTPVTVYLFDEAEVGNR